MCVCGVQKNKGTSRCGCTYTSAGGGMLRTLPIRVEGRNVLPFSEHVCKGSDCVKSTHLPAAETLLRLGVCLSPLLSANEKVRVRKLLHSGIRVAGMKARGLYVAAYINHTRPAPPGTACTQAYKQYIRPLIFLPSPQRPLKRNCRTELNVPQEKTT